MHGIPVEWRVATAAVAALLTLAVAVLIDSYAVAAVAVAILLGVIHSDLKRRLREARPRFRLEMSNDERRRQRQHRRSPQ
jgi:Flp pilus assembly protein TadB